MKLQRYRVLALLAPAAAFALAGCQSDRTAHGAPAWEQERTGAAGEERAQRDAVGAQEGEVAGGEVNGLDTAQLGGLIDTLKEDEGAGRVTFFSQSRWQDGMRTFTRFSGYEVDGEMHHEDSRLFSLLGDEPRELSGTDAAPGAGEELMHALATCLIATTNANAALQGVELSRLEVDLESDFDLHGLFALDPEVRPGVQAMRARIKIAGDADEETLRQIARRGFESSPVAETLRNGIVVRPQINVQEGDLRQAGTLEASAPRGEGEPGRRQQQAPGEVNGLDTERLGGLIDALEQDEQAGQITHFSRSRWLGGMRTLTTITGFEVDGEVLHEEQRLFTLLGDEAVELSGTGAAPGATEQLMYSLSTCLSAATNANAALQGVELSQLQIALESDLDLHGLFALDTPGRPPVRPGILELRADIDIAGDADPETLRQIARQGFETSPVADSLRNGITIEPEVIVLGSGGQERTTLEASSPRPDLDGQSGAAEEAPGDALERQAEQLLREEYRQQEAQERPQQQR